MSFAAEMRTPSPAVGEMNTDAVANPTRCSASIVPSSLSCNSDSLQDQEMEECRVVDPNDISHAVPIMNEYHFGRLLGQGASACVYRCRKRADGSLCALKAAPLNSKNGLTSELMHLETNLALAARHRNVIKTMRVIYHPKVCYMELELMAGDLSYYLRRLRRPLTEEEMRHVLRDCLRGLQYLHSLNILHRDVKLENIFVRDLTTDAKLGDLGLALKVKDSRLWGQYGISGTPSTSSPEMMLGDPYCRTTDVWSMGVAAFEMLSAPASMFPAKDTMTHILKKMEIDAYDFPPPNLFANLDRMRPVVPAERDCTIVCDCVEKLSIGQEAKKVIIRMLSLNAIKRPSASKVLTYPFFKKRHTLPGFSITRKDSRKRHGGTGKPNA